MSEAYIDTTTRFYFLNHRRAELDALFEQLECPREGELSGVYSGYLFAIMGIDSIPGVRRLLYWLLSTFVNPWIGKRFDGERGANYWFTHSGKITFGEYSITSNDKAEQPVSLDYDVEENWKLLRPVQGEVKKISDGVYLARMLYRTEFKTHTVLYFNLLEDYSQ